MPEQELKTALTYVGHTDFEIAWVHPVRLLEGRYIQPLTSEEGYTGFGVEYKTLLSKKAENLLSLYDTFEWEGPGARLGDVLPDVEPLSNNSFKEIII